MKQTSHPNFEDKVGDQTKPEKVRVSFVVLKYLEIF